MKTFIVLVYLSTSLGTQSTLYSNDGSLDTLVSCQEAAAKLSETATRNKEYYYFYCERRVE